MSFLIVGKVCVYSCEVEGIYERFYYFSNICQEKGDLISGGKYKLRYMGKTCDVEEFSYFGWFC